MRRGRKETTHNDENKEPVQPDPELTQMVESPEKNIISYCNCVTYVQTGKQRQGRYKKIQTELQKMKTTILDTNKYSGRD